MWVIRVYNSFVDKRKSIISDINENNTVERNYLAGSSGNFSITNDITKCYVYKIKNNALGAIDHTEKEIKLYNRYFNSSPLKDKFLSIEKLTIEEFNEYLDGKIKHYEIQHKKRIDRIEAERVKYGKEKLSQ